MDNNNIQQKTSEWSRSRRKKKAWQRVLAGMMAIVVFSTTYSMILPAITAEPETFCGQEAHVHDESCYLEQRDLICPLEEGERHTHGEACYAEQPVLLCTQDETAAHTHGDACYTEVTEYVCGLEESAGHTHSEDCYLEKTQYACGLEESAGHTHSEACYTQEKRLACGNDDPDHEHTDDCYVTESVLSCPLEESEGHSHSDACLATMWELICGKEESEGHTHSDACVKTERVLNCGLEETEGHTHGEACWGTEQVLSCGKPENTDAHIHGDDCYEVTQVLNCEKEEHEHSLACFADLTYGLENEASWSKCVSGARLTGIWSEDIIAVAATQLGYSANERNYIVDENSNIHSYTRFGAWSGDAYGPWNAAFVSFVLTYAGVPESVMPRDNSAAGLAAKASALGIYRTAGDYSPKAGDLIFISSENNGMTDRVGLVYQVNGENLTAIEGERGNSVTTCSYSTANPAVLGFAELADNRSTESEVTPEEPQSLDPGAEDLTPPETEHTPAEPQEGAAESGENWVETEILTARVNGVTVTLTAAADSLPFPAEELTLSVTPVEDAAAVALIEEGLETAEGAERRTLLFNIAILHNGEEVEPLGPVSVRFEGLDGLVDGAQVFYVDEERSEAAAMETQDAGEGALDFTATHFSDYGVSYILGAPLLGAGENTPPTVELVWKEGSADYTIDGDVISLLPVNNKYDATAATAANEVIASIKLSTTREQIFQPGELEIRVPKQLFTDRNGNKYGEVITAIPLAPNTADGTDFYYNVEGDEIVITNYRALDLTTMLTMDLLYPFRPSMIVSGSQHVMSLTMNDKRSDPAATVTKQLIAEVKTNSKIISQSVAFNGQAKQWNNDRYGAPIANVEDYFFIEYAYNIDFSGSGGTNTQPYSVKFDSIDVGQNGMLLGYAIGYGRRYVGYNEFPNSYVRGDVEALKNQTIYAVDTVDQNVIDCYRGPDGLSSLWGAHVDLLVAYPRSILAEQPDGSFKADVSISTTAKLTGWDGDCTDIKTSSTTKDYAEVEFVYEGDLFEVTKRSTTLDADAPAISIALLRNGLDGDSGAEMWVGATARGYSLTAGGTREYTVELIDDQLYLAGELLLPGDYSYTRIGSVSTGESLFGWDENTSSLKLTHRSTPMKVFYRSSTTGEWTYWQDVASDGSGAARFIDLPANVYQIKMVYTGSAYSVNMRYHLFATLHPTSHVLSILEGRASATVTNVDTLRVIDADGNVANAVSDVTIYGNLKPQVKAHDRAEAEDAALRNEYTIPADKYFQHNSSSKIIYDAVQGAAFRKRASIPVLDAEHLLSRVTYTLEEGNIMIIPKGVNATLEQLQALGIDPVQRHVVFYDLLPQGMYPELDSIVIQNAEAHDFWHSGAAPVSDYEGAYTAVTVDNWRGSGRVMLIITIDNPGAVPAFDREIRYSPGGWSHGRVISSGYRVSYSAAYPWDAIADYGASTLNLAAVQLDGMEIGGTVETNSPLMYGHYDNAASASAIPSAAKSWFHDLDGDGNPGPVKRNTMYANCPASFRSQDVTQTGMSKKVRSEASTGYSRNAVVDLDGNYSYQLRYQTAPHTTAKSIRIFDVFEEDHGVLPYWRGSFRGVDVTQPTAMGVDMKVYYSTKHGLNPHLDENDSNVTNAAVWSLTPPADLSTVTAVCFDMSQASGGGDYILPKGAALTCVIHMKAPADMSQVPDVNAGAYNKSVIECVQRASDSSPWSDMFKELSGTTVVKLRGTDPNIITVSGRKTWTGVPDGEAVPAVTIKLLQNGVEIDRTIISSDERDYLFLNLPRLDAQNQPYTYTIEEVPIYGFTTVIGTPKTDSLGNVTIDLTNTYIPRNGSLTFTKVSSVDSSVKLQNAVFGLYRTAAVSGTSISCTNPASAPVPSDKNGVVSFSGLTLGTYYLKEESAPDNYEGAGRVWVAEVTSTGSTIYEATISSGAVIKGSAVTPAGVISNTPKTGDLSFTKVSSADRTVKLKDAEFELYKKASASGGNVTFTDMVGTMKKSNGNGVVEFTDLLYGTYYLKEKTPPEGYTGIGPGWVVEIGEGGGKIYAMVVSGNTVNKGALITGNLIENKPSNASVKVWKDVLGEVSTKSFSFEVTLKDASGAVVKLTPGNYTGYSVDAAGKITFSITEGEANGVTIRDVPLGTKLTITETNSEGYIVLIKPVGMSPGKGNTMADIPVNADLTIEVDNSTGTVLPSTGGPGTLLYTIGGLALMGGALIYGLARRRRERRFEA